MDAIRAILSKNKSSVAPSAPAPTKAVTVSASPKASARSSASVDEKSSRTFYIMLAALSFVAVLLLYQRYQESLAADESNAQEHMKANPLTPDQIEKLRKATQEKERDVATGSASVKRNTPTVEEISSSSDEEPEPPEPKAVRRATKVKRAPPKKEVRRSSSRLGKRKNAKLREDPIPEEGSESDDGAGTQVGENDPNFQRIEEADDDDDDEQQAKN